MEWNQDLAPPKQRRGNFVGKWLAAYYLKPENQNKPLSQAYADYFSSGAIAPIDDETPGRSLWVKY